MSNKRVVFEIELDAETNIEAAMTVQEWLADGTKYQFNIQDVETSKTVSVDLNEHETCMESPVNYVPMIKTGYEGLDVTVKERLIDLWKTRRIAEDNLINNLRWQNSDEKIMVSVTNIRDLNNRISELEMLIDNKEIHKMKEVLNV